MTDLRALLAPIRERASTARDKNFVERAKTESQLIDTDLSRLLATVEEVLGISEIKMTSEHGDPAFAQGWECAIEEMHARVAAALGSDTTNQEGTQ